MTSFRRFFVSAVFVAGLLAFTGRARAQSFDPAADDGFAPLTVGTNFTPARWFTSNETIYWSKDSTHSAGGGTVPFSSFQTAVTSSAQAWNNALISKGIDFSLSLSAWKPAIPDTVTVSGTPLTNGPLYCQSDPCSLDGADTCIFKAYNSSGQYVCYNSDFTAQTVFGQPGCTLDSQITRLCSLYVEWNRSPADLSVAPTSLQPVRDANGIIQVGGNGRNELFVEEADFVNAVKAYVTDASATLALTVTRATINPSLNFAEINEADIFINGDNLFVPDQTHPSPLDHEPNWLTAGIYGSSGSCARSGTTAPDTSSVPDTANTNNNPLCYVGTYAYGEFNFDLQNVMTHEMGHLLGFGHPCDDVPQAQRNACRHVNVNGVLDPHPSPVTSQTDTAPIDKVSDTTMFWVAFGGQNTKRSLSSADIAGLDRVFAAITGAGGGSGGGGCDAGSGAPLLPLFAAVMAAVLWRFFPVRRAAVRVRSRRSRFMKYLVILCAALGVAGSALATTVIPLSTEDLVGRSELIVEGVVRESRVRAEAGGAAVITEHRLEVLDVLMGLPAPQLWFAVPGGQIGNQLVTVAGAPRFQEGDRAFFFLKYQGGHWIVTGLSQGAKPVFRLDDGTLAVDAPRDSKVKTGKAAADADSIGVEAFRAQVRGLVNALSERHK